MKKKQTTKHKSSIQMAWVLSRAERAIVKNKVASLALRGFATEIALTGDITGRKQMELNAIVRLLERRQERLDCFLVELDMVSKFATRE